ncbi:hypothetical protein C0995_012399 [Termitomyces sp. Mi166|nr:hypothetical protein C0995_012399 [Termitomyces sp. Mi166\
MVKVLTKIKPHWHRGGWLVAQTQSSQHIYNACPDELFQEDREAVVRFIHDTNISQFHFPGTVRHDIDVDHVSPTNIISINYTEITSIGRVLCANPSGKA